MQDSNATLPENQDSHLLAELRQWAQWVVYRYPDKAPRKTNGELAEIDNPATWTTYEAAKAAVGTNGIDGIGFVLTAECGLTCVDLDATDDAAIQARQTQIYSELFPTAYAERSPSGKGVHLWMRGHVASRKASKIEVYSAGRYMTITGDVVAGRNLPLPDAQENLIDLIAALDRISGKTAASPTYDFPELRTDDEVRGLVLADAKGAALWHAKPTDWKPVQSSPAIAAYGYPSQSEADAALAQVIATRSGNRAQTRRLWLESGLAQRAKAKRIGYQLGTMEVEYSPVLPLSTLEAIDRQWQQFQEKQRNPRSRIIAGIADIPRLSDYGDVQTDYIVPGLIVANAITLLTGAAGGGKSTVTSVLAEAISTGGEFLGRKCQSREVLYLDRENPLGVVKNRFRNFNLSEANARFHYFGQFTGSEVPQPSEPWIIEWAQSLDTPPVIIVDGFTAFLDGGNETKPEITRPWFNSLKPLVKAGCAVIVFHHTGKGESTKPYRGGTDIIAAIDNGFMLESTYDDEGKFDELVLTSFEKMRYQVDPRIEFVCADGVFILKSETPSNVTERGELYSLLQQSDGKSKNQFELDAVEILKVRKNQARSFLADAVRQKHARYDKGLRGAQIIRLIATGAK
jgi:hypothetical protein